MRYIFEEGNQVGEFPVKDFQIAWFDKDNMGFDEDFITPERFKVHDLPYVETEEEKENNIDHSRVFVNMKNGDRYELVLKKCE